MSPTNRAVKTAAIVLFRLLLLSARRLISFDTTACAPESERYLFAQSANSSSDAFLASSGVILADIKFLSVWWQTVHGSTPFRSGEDDPNDLTEYGALMQIEFQEFMRRLHAAAATNKTPNV